MLNTNVSPYYDDYNPTKDFHRILYKPGKAVQARELNQMQTIAQQQVSYFGSSIYSQNSPVSGGGVTTNLDCYFIKLCYKFSINTVNVNDFDKRIITNADGDVQAQVLAVASGTDVEDGSGDQPTLIVNYLSGSKFKNDDTIYILSNNVKTPKATVYPKAEDKENPCTGPASTANVAEGVFFVMNGSNKAFDDNTQETVEYKTGTFVRVGKQTIILDKYSNEPSYRIGLDIEESIVTADQDASLYDPALESSNFEAPGADRYKIYLRLVKKSLDYGDDENFIELCKIENGIVKKQVESDIYSTLDDYFAKRTYDTNGDFIVSDFDIEPIAYTEEDWTNEDGIVQDKDKEILSAKYKLKIGKGLAYVRGYRIENQSDLILQNDRARTTDSSKKFMYMNYGNYVKVRNGAKNIFKENQPNIQLKLYAVATPSASTTPIGTANVKTVLYSNTLGDADRTNIYDLYLTDIKTVSNSFNVSSLVNTTTQVEGSQTDVVQMTTESTNVAGSIAVGSRLSIKEINYSGIVVGNSEANIFVTPSLVTSVSKDSYTATITNSISNVKSLGISGTEYVVVDSSGMDSDGNTILYETSNNNVIMSLGNSYAKSVSYLDYDKCSVYRNGSENAQVIGYTGGGKNFITYSTDNSSFNSADEFVAQGKYKMAFVRNNMYNRPSDKLKYIRSVWEGESDLTIDGTTLVGAMSNLKDGRIYTNKSDEIDFGWTYYKSVSDEDKLDVSGKSNVYKFCLYVPHVTNFHVFKLRDSTSFTASGAKLRELIVNSENITNQFVLDDGQRDDYVGHAYITTKNGSTFSAPHGFFVLYDALIPTVQTDELATSDKTGYYSIDAYETSGYQNFNNIYDLTYKSTSGSEYRLVDCLDFRPRIARGDTDHITATFMTNGIVQDDNSISCLYEYYLGRIDVLVLSRDASFQIIQGAPSLNPKSPEVPSGCLLVATIIHDPYTYYLPEEAPKGVRPNLRIVKNYARRWTMNDISTLNKRIDNVEYYTAMNMLEQTAQNMQIMDSDGLNRFKNGILVDNFTSYLVADTRNSEFNASINRVDGKMSMAHDVDNFALVELYSSDTNIKKKIINTTTNTYMLPYTEKIVAEQILASNTVNVNPFGVSIYQGSMSINPPMDNWVDNTKEPDVYIVDEGMAFYTESDDLNVLNVTNWATIPGSSKTTDEIVSKSSTTSTSTKDVKTGRYTGHIDTVVTTTTTTNYKTTKTTEQSRQITSGYWSYAGDSYRNENGYLTDVSIQPYIRPQDLLIYAEGMASNAKVSTWFDGVNVDDCFKLADVIEMKYSKNAIGFVRGDIIGYQKSSSSIYPIGTVVGTYYNENDKIARLYVISSYLTNAIIKDDITIVPISKNGSTWSVQTGRNSTYGEIVNGRIISDSYSGKLVSVGMINDASTESSKTLYNHYVSENSEFLKRYGCYGSYLGSSDDGFVHTFSYIPDESMDVYPCYQSTLLGSILITEIDGETTKTIGDYRISLTSIYTDSDDSQKISLTAGKEYRIKVDISSKGSETINNQIGIALSTSPWTLSGETNGSIVWSTKTPFMRNVSDTKNYFSSNVYVNGGGCIYTNVKKVSVGSSSKSLNNERYYSGAKITFDSYNVDTSGRIYKMKPQMAVIDTYDKDEGTVTLDSPVTLSFGWNNLSSLDLTSSYNIQGSTTYKLSSYSVAGISTNEDGVIAGIFTIPAETFKTGERKFRIDNRTTENDINSATTYSEGIFTASGLSTKSQSLSFSASIDSMANTSMTSEYRTIKSVSYSKDVKTTSKVTKSVSYNTDPLAQTFIVNSEEFPNGCFLSGIKVFFQSKPVDTNTPITLRIVTTDTGYPTTTDLDNSIVTLTADKINVSQEPSHKNANTYTKFEFQTPVYIQPDVLYAFVLKSDSTDYNVWMAKQNNIALQSTLDTVEENVITKIGNVPYVGNIFESQNASTWVADPSASMMFIIERCQFDVTKKPSVTFGIPKGNPQRKSLVNDSYSLYSTFNENGDFESDAYNFTTTDFTPSGTLIEYSYEATSSTARIGGKINPGTYGCPTYENVLLNDGYGPRWILSGDDTSLAVTATLSSEDDAISPILCDDGLTVYNIKYRQDMNPSILNEDGEIVDNPNYKRAKAVYITQKATLASGSASEDIIIYLTGYRPYGTDYTVSVKLLSPDDSAQFDENGWVKLERLGETDIYSESKDDIIELSYAYGSKGVANRSIAYTSSNGETYSNFNQFAIKIELTTNDNTNIPYVNSLIAIALPDGN